MTNLDNKSINSISKSLQELLERLKSDRETINERIRQIEKDLSSLGKDTLFESTGKSRKRRKRGANKKAVCDFFDANENIEVTAYEIAKRLEIPRSSIQAVLDSLEKKGVLEQKEDGSWRKKE